MGRAQKKGGEAEHLATFPLRHSVDIFHVGGVLAVDSVER